MSFFIDTSAFLAVLDADDKNHKKAKEKKAVIAFQESVIPMLSIEWVDESLHHAGITSMLTANRRELSLVDCVSFDMMRRLGLKRVFTFDKHFKEQGFECFP